MKKKLLSILLTLTMVAALLAGCGSNDDGKETNKDNGTKTSTDDKGSKDADKGSSEVAASEGKVLNIHCWNTEFQDRVRDFYPGYVANDDGTGTIGDVKVNWVITPSENLAYQNALDAALLAQADTAADDKVDLFLIEADYALKYVNAAEPVAMALSDIGVTDADLGNQFQYTRDIVTDGSGVQRATSWQAAPGAFFYNTDVAEAVLGTSDPDQVQSKISNWDDFNAVAQLAFDKGYKMLSGYDDSYRVFSNNVSAPWIKDNKIQIDPSINTWIEQTMDYTTKGFNNKSILWDGQWASDQGPDTKVLGFFMPGWGLDFVITGNSLANSEAAKEVGNGDFGKWKAAVGPASYYWGGTWICGAIGTDNVSLVKDIMLKLTCDAGIMEEITKAVNDFTNNKEAMNKVANSDYGSAMLGGQNHIKIFAQSADNIDMSNTSPYDQRCNEEMQKAMHDYFNGTVTYDQALQNFYDSVTTLHPELSY